MSRTVDPKPCTPAHLGIRLPRTEKQGPPSPVRQTRVNYCRKVFAEGARQRLTDHDAVLLVGIRRLEPAVSVLRTFDQSTRRLT